jgi:hypothetical protein
MEQTKLIFAFNKIYVDFLKDVRSTNANLKALIKSEYKVVDKLSEEYINEFAKEFGTAELPWTTDFTQFVSDLFSETKYSSRNVFRNIQLSSVKGPLKTLQTYMITLHLLEYLHHLSSVSTVSDDLFNASMKALGTIESGNTENLDQLLEPLQEQTHICEILKYLNQQEEDNQSKENSLPPMPESLEFLENSKIGSLAKEISSQIDIGQLNIDPNDPDGISKGLSGMFSGENNALTNIIQKVGSTIQDKIQTGELRHEDLLKEAFSLMGRMQGGGGGGGMPGMPPGFMDMMTGMMGGMNLGGGVQKKRNDRASARDRLKKKIEKRKQQLNKISDKASAETTTAE